MTKRKRNWAWRRLLESAPPRQRATKKPMDIEEKRTEGEVVML
jgi:hypothetical protein